MKGIELLPSKTVNISEITLDEKNPNVMTQQQMDSLAKFMRKRGFAVEVWLNKRKKGGGYTCIDGAHRIQILKENGITKVSAKIFSVSDSQVRIMRQIANKLSGVHDKKKDLEEFKAIYDAGELDELADLLAMPIEDFESALEKGYDEITFDKSLDDIPEPPKKPKSKLGQIYELGAWTYCPQCNKRHDI